jgi:hypothetical protein
VESTREKCSDPLKVSISANKCSGQPPRSFNASKLLHQVLSDSPHPRPLSVNVHWDAKKKKAHLNATNAQKNLFRSVGFKPAGEEERKDKAVKNI